MQPLKTVISLLLLTLWSVAGVHCKLELLPGMAFLQCPTNAGSAKDCETDECETVESAAYKAPDQQKALAKPVLAQMPALAACLEEIDHFPPRTWNSVAPPELTPSWLFLSRAVPPIRAPSRIS